MVRRGMPGALDEELADGGPSPLDAAIARQTESLYRQALAALSLDDRELIVGHVELAYTHAQLAHMTGRTPNAARMALQRAIHRLAQQMRHG